jgi:protein OS-9
VTRLVAVGKLKSRSVVLLRSAFRARHSTQLAPSKFHCSASIMDSIMFVKETSTCKYVLVVHTPRLCGEPGFKSRIDQTADAPIRCREIVDKINPKDERSLTSSRHPVARVINSLGGSKQETIAKSEKKPKKVAVEDDKISFLKKLIEGMVLRGSKEVDVPAQLLNMDEADPEQIWVVDGEDALTKLVDNMRGSKAKSKEAQRNAANEEEDDDSENTERTPRDEL